MSGDVKYGLKTRLKTMHIAGPGLAGTSRFDLSTERLPPLPHPP